MKTYPTKIDAWAWPILVFTMLSGPASLIFGFLQFSSNRTGAWIFLGTGVFMLLIAVGLCWPVNYTLTEDTLIIRFGWVRSKIPYAKIKEVYPTRNILSSPAWSLDRLWIDYEGLFAMISPQDKEAFLQDLASRDPGLKLQDGKITREG